MAEDRYINAGSKTEKYRALLPQLKNLLAGEDDLIWSVLVVIGIDVYKRHE